MEFGNFIKCRTELRKHNKNTHLSEDPGKYEEYPSCKAIACKNLHKLVHREGQQYKTHIIEYRMENAECLTCCSEFIEWQAFKIVGTLCGSRGWLGSPVELKEKKISRRQNFWKKTVSEQLQLLRKLHQLIGD